MLNSVISEIPNDFEAEQAVLGSIIYDNEMIYRALDAVKKPTSFYTPAHQYIFRAMLELHDKKLPIDEISLGDQLKSLSQLEEIGGYSYLASLQDCVPSSMNVFHYGKIVARHSQLRQLITLTTDTARKSRDPESEVSELLDDTIGKLMDLRADLDSDTIVRKVSDALPKIRERVELASQGKISYGLPTKYGEIDKMTGGGFQNTELAIIGARPSMGKTSLAMCLAYQACSMNKKALFISLESKEESLIRDRLLPSITNIQSNTFKTGKLDQDQWESFDNVIATDPAIDNFKITDKSGLNCSDIYSLAKIEYEQFGLSLLLVDFIQLVRPVRKHSRRDQELGEVAECLKDIAKDFNIPVVALSQLNRDVEKTKRKPTYADLRDSGELEQIADVIILLHQDEDPDDERLMDLIFGKNRNGRRGTVNLNFIKEYTRFQNI